MSIRRWASRTFLVWWIGAFTWSSCKDFRSQAEGSSDHSAGPDAATRDGRDVIDAATGGSGGGIAISQGGGAGGATTAVVMDAGIPSGSAGGSGGGGGGSRDGSPGEVLANCFPGSVRPCQSDPDLHALGSCAAGTEICTGGRWGACSVQPVSKDSCAIVGDDANCNGRPNDGCACVDGSRQACGPAADLGICKRGTQLCAAGTWGACSGAVYAGPRDCTSAADNNCDGVQDNVPDAICGGAAMDGGPPRDAASEAGLGIVPRDGGADGGGGASGSPSRDGGAGGGSAGPLRDGGAGGGSAGPLRDAGAGGGPGANLCNDLTFGPPVFFNSHVAARPASEAPLGGALVDGTYDLVSDDFYVTAQEETSTTPIQRTLGVSQGGTILDEIVYSDVSRRWALSVSGTSLVMMLRCGSSGSDPYIQGYTASANRIILTTPLWVIVFNRRP